MSKGPGPTQWAQVAGRKASSRSQRRALAAKMAKELQETYRGLSLPALKKLARRKKPKT